MYSTRRVWEVQGDCRICWKNEKAIIAKMGIGVNPTTLYPGTYKATQSDVMPILKVINEQAVHDNTKIVILPKNFRQIVLEDNVSKSKLYCVKQHSSDEIIAFKKLFIIST